MWFMRVILCAFTCFMFLQQSVEAIEPEDGPAFMTDSHGATGVGWFLREIRAVEPTYDRYYFGTLDWLVATAIWEGDMCAWWKSMTAPIPTTDW